MSAAGRPYRQLTSCGSYCSGLPRTRRKKWKRLAILVPATVCFVIMGYLRNAHQHQHQSTAAELSELPVILNADEVLLPGSAESAAASEWLPQWSVVSSYQAKPHQRALLQDSTSGSSDSNSPNTNNQTSEKPSNFPPDPFTMEQRKNGAIILHICGLIYMFVALAIVCDEFFVPSLDVITEKMGISEDVAGATFMAAGGSAPELFTSIIGVFISLDDVGIGTIVGSAVFNILFVISMCALFSKTVLELTWWPLFRDVSFYALILISLILCFRDSRIYWYEALFLLAWYAAYVTFMKYNELVEKTIKRLLNRNKVNGINQSAASVVAAVGTVDIPPSDRFMGRRQSVPILHGGSKFRHGVVQLIIHSVDPLHQETIPDGQARTNSLGNAKTDLGQLPGSVDSNSNNPSAPDATNASHLNHQSVDSVDGGDEPLDMSWPSVWHKRITYVLLFPIIIPLWLTLPDVRRPEKRKYFAGSFLGSIIWIAIFSYLMVWWATLTGETFNVPSEIMGLTFLAAGTSIPDLITSVLVARKGLGDMAVSSSVGSNIFDVTVGLPFPWLLYTIYFGSEVQVNSTGMACSVMILFLMLLFVVITIAAFRWKLNVAMAVVMFLLYFVFIAISLLLQKEIIKCSSVIDIF